MAFDGVVISNVVSDLKKKLVDGRIYKIYQPENDELNIIIKNNRENYRLLLSADASLPLIYLLPALLSDRTTAVYLAEPVADVIAVTCTAILFATQFRKALHKLEASA